MSNENEKTLKDLIEGLSEQCRSIREIVLDAWIDKAEANGLDPTPFMDRYNYSYEIREIYGSEDLEKAKQDAEKTNSYLFQPSTGGVVYLVKKKG